MALSFGRKKADAANDAGNNIKSEANGTHNAPQTTGAPRSGAGTGDESIDESWFESFSEDAPASPAPPVDPGAATDFSTPAPDFSVFDTQSEEQQDFGGFSDPATLSSTTDTTLNPLGDSGAFTDPATSSGTPFDMPAAVPVASEEKPKKGGLKKLLPILLVLLVVIGGGAFWYAQYQQQQINTDTDDGGFGVATATGAAPSQAPTGSAPTGAAPTGAAPTGGAPTSAPPTGAAPTGAAPKSGSPSANPDPKFKAQLKKLWDEGFALRKQNKLVAAKAKWGAAVRLARSKPGHEKSAGMIQQAIDKLK